jgi:hypothetical protein
MRLLLLAVLVRALAAQIAPVPLPDDNLPVFGTTVVVPGGFCGEIYDLRENAGKLPNFRKLEPLGAIYTTALNVPLREWTTGFPGVTQRFEWFAIDYRARFWIETPGEYQFSLVSDDGSELYIDGKRVINNNGLHDSKLAKTAKVALNRGIHSIRVPYFQGLRFHVALVLQVAPPGGKLRVFDTNDFKPSSNPDEWSFETAGNALQKVEPSGGQPDRRRLSVKGQLAQQGSHRSGCPVDW